MESRALRVRTEQGTEEFSKYWHNTVTGFDSTFRITTPVQQGVGHDHSVLAPVDKDSTALLSYYILWTQVGTYISAVIS